MTVGSSGSRGVSQCELQLGDKRRVIPWDGVSPRLLTRCGKLFSLRAPPPGGLIELTIPGGVSTDPGGRKDQFVFFIGGRDGT